MRTFPVFLISLLTVGMMGCHPLAEKIGEKPQSYEIVSARRSKHSTVHVRNVITQETFRVRISRTCATRMHKKIGQRVTLMEGTYQDSQIFRRLENAKATLCQP